METKKIKREEIRRLIKAVKAGKKEYLAEWISQFDEQRRFEYSKQVEESIKKGMENKGFNNYIVVNDLYEAFAKLQEIQVSHENLIALFEKKI